MSDGDNVIDLADHFQRQNEERFPFLRNFKRVPPTIANVEMPDGTVVTEEQMREAAREVIRETGGRFILSRFD